MLDTPQARYQRDLAGAAFQHDAAQERAVQRLEQLYQALIAQPSSSRRLWWRSLVARKPQPVTGIYMWGGVGRGKTYLMDAFYETLPFPEKMRTHFHRFMRRVHAELTELKGQKNPLEQVAERLAREARVVCFDEFFVADIADAMILGNLLRALFERGVTLVATSNVPPHALYENGLQRERFLPAIAWLQAHTDVVNVDGGVDYRLRSLVQAQLYYHPLGTCAEQALAGCFQQLVPDPQSVREQVPLSIEGREIIAFKEAEDVVWLDFPALCDGPRSQNDYIVLAKEYHAVLISNVPPLGSHNEDQARRFLYLVDEFYDRRVKLILSAAQPLTQIYGQGKLAFEFERVTSRLLEMQSQDYLAEAHRP